MIRPGGPQSATRVLRPKVLGPQLLVSDRSLEGGLFLPASQGLGAIGSRLQIGSTIWEAH